MRWFAAVAVAALVAAAVSVAAVFLLRPSVIGGRGPQAAIPGAAEGSVNAARRAQGAVVLVEATLADGSMSLATGSIIDSHGFVLTAEAAVATAAHVSVAVPGGKRLDARVVGTDPVTALTLLRVDAPNLKAVQLPSGGTPLETGTGIVVISATRGLALRVGAVSASGVSVLTDDPARKGQKLALNDLLSLDVSPQGGQLGAPILDGAGRLVGVVIATGDAILGADLSEAIAGLQQLMVSGHVTHPALGFAYRQLSPTELVDRGLPGGVEVVSVVPGGAAERGGLLPADVVTALGGTALDGAHPLRRLLAGLSANQDVTLTVRGTTGSERKVTVRVTLEAP